MIRINKGDSPKGLVSNGVALTNSNIVLYNGGTNLYKRGKKTFTFTNAYKSEEVKKALIECQNNKCCFSEAKFTGDYPDVEHFRPKGRIDDYFTNDKLYPGYYWLAYKWENLFLSKTRPNTSQKRNFFPLYSEKNRNRDHTEKKIEKPYLIDPGAEDPRDFIKFHGEEPIGVDLDGRGKFNIDFFDLRHPEFEEARRTKLGLLNSLKNSVDIMISVGIELDNPVIINNLNELRNAMLPKSEFSSMAIDLLKDWPHLP